MGRLFLSIFLAAAAVLSAAGPQLYRDEDTGLVLEIPEGIEQTWNLNQPQMGIEFTLFQSQAYPMYMIMAGKVSLSLFEGLDGEEVITLMLSQLQQGFDEESEVTVESMPAIGDSSYSWERIHIEFKLEEQEQSDVLADLNLFVFDQYVSIVGTILYGADGTDNDFELFSKQVVEKARFLEN